MGTAFCIDIWVGNVAIVKTCEPQHNWLSQQNSYSHVNTNNFDWSLVRSFLAALEHGSLLGAARALGTSQPTLGRHMAELELQLGVLLFERTGRGLLPTEAALQLAEGAPPPPARGAPPAPGGAGGGAGAAGAGGG